MLEALNCGCNFRTNMVCGLPNIVKLGLRGRDRSRDRRHPWCASHLFAMFPIVVAFGHGETQEAVENGESLP